MNREWSNVQSPEENAGVFSKTFYWWILPFVWKGYRSKLGPQDIYKTRKSDSAEHVGMILEREWLKEVDIATSGGKPNLIKAAFRTSSRKLTILAIVIVIVQSLLRFLQALLLSWVIRHYSGNSEDCVNKWPPPSFFGEETACISTKQCYISAAGLIVTLFVVSVGYKKIMLNGEIIARRFGVAFSVLIYRKFLKLSPNALANVTCGHLLNLLSNDVGGISRMTLLFQLIAAPIHIVLITGFLWPFLGFSSLIGSAIFVLYLWLQTCTTKYIRHYGKQTAPLTDKRTQLINEMVTGMRVVKMYTWEKPLLEMIADVRRTEMTNILFSGQIKSFISCMGFILVKFVPFCVFLPLIYISDRPLTAEVVFVTMFLYACTRDTTVYFFMAVSLAAEGLVIKERIQRFLLLEEISSSEKSEDKEKHTCVRLNNATAQWNDTLKVPTLVDITVEVKPGEMLAVVGPVGSGKSSFLMTIAGELCLKSGTRDVKGKIAYVSQDPWILNDSIKNNILFGKEFEAEKYKKILYVCALEKDLSQLSSGDMTLVGERGARLSGGQKARITLARALYFDADIYLLDDPLSAVDTDVAHHLFDKCLKGYLKNKVRILVTHQLQFIEEANSIMLLKGGKCITIGNLEDLRKEDSESILHHSMHNSSSMSSTDQEIFINNVSLDSKFSDELEKNMVNRKPPVAETESPSSANASVYWIFAREGSAIFTLVVLLLCYIITQSNYQGVDFWLRIWTSNVISRLRSNTTCSDDVGNPGSLMECQPTLFYVSVYSGLCVGLFVLAAFRNGLLNLMCVKASQKIHNRMLTSIIRSPISFFDRNPSGVIMNRVTKDIGIIDRIIPLTLTENLNMNFVTLGGIAAQLFIQAYLFIPTLFLVIAFYFLVKVYTPTAQPLKQLDATTRSPVFSHTNLTYQGLRTIRAFKVQKMFENTFYEYLDINTRCYSMFNFLSKWLATAMDQIAIVYLAIIIVLLFNDPSDGGYVGLSITTALTMCLLIQINITQGAELNQQMLSVERVNEYCNLKPEAELDSSPEKKPPKEWPQRGGITFKQVSLNYRQQEISALRGIDFEVKPVEKIGIIGRTGAGKSSLIAALFRMVEPEGVISIDGVDIKDIGLHDLRSKISIIPQDPVLFSGTVRKNIDPFGMNDDDCLWNVLEEVQLKEVVRLLPGGLEAVLLEGGSNFSVGERQLICLARVILRNNKILVLDEATSNIDNKTDSLIQRTLREKFRHCTILTVAHRLNTVMDCDRIMVLDSGRIQEFDEPYNLLQNRNSLMYKMVQKTGPVLAEHFRKIAEKAWISRKLGSSKIGNNNLHITGDAYPAEDLKFIDSETVVSEKRQIYDVVRNEDSVQRLKFKVGSDNPGYIAENTKL